MQSYECEQTTTYGFPIHAGSDGHLIITDLELTPLPKYYAEKEAMRMAEVCEQCPIQSTCNPSPTIIEVGLNKYVKGIEPGSNMPIEFFQRTE